ncbi:insulysin [Malassezia psittaci]|uniref:Insulysin n=1 Tax=Malassezia psittaci TaxID=1821823 RepID=A0AAF0F4M9_9BASI|nr:insulysin [Malassezia psittaci]
MLGRRSVSLKPLYSTRLPNRLLAPPAQSFSARPLSYKTLSRPSVAKYLLNPAGSKCLAERQHLHRYMATETRMPSPEEARNAGFVTKHITLSDGTTASYEAFQGQIEKPVMDECDYELIRLPNKLEAVVISDPETDKASAAMDVRVGHLSDPQDLQGMAHYCEHLLFMGTKKYPRENEYSEYLSNHNGSSNAYTSLDETNYYFDVGHEHFEGALDRFAQFFLEPLFDASCSEREIRAVDSEHKKNLQSDLWRSYQLEKSVSDSSHPYSKFGTGNLDTLWDQPRSRGIEIRDELLKFHQKYYSANLMKLVVIGREPIEQLTRWVVDKFSSVPNKQSEVPRFPSSPLGAEQLGTQVMFRTIKEIRTLELTFPFPEQTYHYKSKPGQMISHFLGHEGHGSLFSCLKQRGWVNMLSAGSGVSVEGFELFKIMLELTPDGYKHYQDVCAAIFQYLDLLRSQPIENWMFDEVKKLSELRFAFKERMRPASYTSALASQMQLPMPSEWILSGAYIVREFDKQLIQETLSALRPENCRMMLAGLEPPEGYTLDKKETWYGTEYTVAPLPAEVLTKNHATLDGLELPKQNEFIPSNLDVLSSKDTSRLPAERPQLIQNTPTLRAWHKQDDRFFLPKADVVLLLRTPRVNLSPRTAVLSRVMVELVKDALSEYSYDAEVAGLQYNVDSQFEGIAVVVAGYNDKLPLLLKSVLHTLTTLKVDKKRFEIIMDQVRRNYANFDMEEPYQHAVYYSQYLITETIWTQKEKLGVMQAIQSEDVQEYCRWVYEQLHIEMLVHGNMTRSQTQSLVDQVEQYFQVSALPEQDRSPPSSLLLPTGSDSAWKLPVANPGNLNSSLEYYLQVGDPTDVKLRATLSLFAQIANEPCFDQLRTKEQLGYLVFSGVRRNVGAMGFRVIVQSERDSDYLASRIDAFLVQLKGLLTGMNAEEFSAHQRSLINKKRETMKNLGEETSRLWTAIQSGYYDFSSRERDIEQLEQLTKDDVLAFMDTYVHPDSMQRAKSVTHLQAQSQSTALSAEALEKFFALLRQEGATIPNEMRDAIQAQAQSVEALRELVQMLYTQQSDALPMPQADLLAAIDRFSTEFPGNPKSKREPENSPAGALPVHNIENVAEFKAALKPSAVPQPVKPWSEYEKPVTPKLANASDSHTSGASAESTQSVRANM